MSTDGLKWGNLPVTVPQNLLCHSDRVRNHLVDFDEDAERARRVELFRRAVESGLYEVDSLTIADKLLDSGEFDREEEL